MWKQSAIKRLDTECSPYTRYLNDATHKRTKLIQKEVKYVTTFVKVHLVLAVITGCIIIPVGKERKLQFILTFLKDHHLSILEMLYYPMFPIYALLSVRLPHGLLYFVSHTKFSVYVCLDFIQEICSDYDNKDDNELLESKEYQDVVRERLISVVTKMQNLMK